MVTLTGMFLGVIVIDLIRETVNTYSCAASLWRSIPAYSLFCLVYAIFAYDAAIVAMAVSYTHNGVCFSVCEQSLISGRSSAAGRGYTEPAADGDARDVVSGALASPLCARAVDVL